MKKPLSMLLALALVIGLLGVVPVQAEDIPDVTEYSYTVTPILSPFTYYLYVKTDNPDPTSFRLVDRESKFYGPDSQGEIFITNGDLDLVQVDPGTYYISQKIYADVVYENESTYRVPGGYIFIARRSYSDGGEFVLMQKTRSGRNLAHDEFVATDVTIPCQPLSTKVSYLIDTCTTEEMSFFEKLDAVQAQLNKLAVYPRSVRDMDTPNENCPYPYLAVSPYPELGLNDHYAMFKSLPVGMLASAGYPFVLNSESFPGTITSVARMLEPSCVVVRAGVHYLRNITFEGETHTYGGAGLGGDDPLYSHRVQKVFTFSGEDDFGTNGTIEGYYTLLRSYQPVAEADAEVYRDLIRGTTFRQTIRATGGTWIKVAMEAGIDPAIGRFGYVVPLGDKVMTLSDAWVDGRYVGNHEAIVLGEKFEDHPTADIVLHDVTFADCNGQIHTQDVAYSYDRDKDAWTAPYFFSGAFSYSTTMGELPEELILTREEVEAMDLDCNSNHLPESGLVYDGMEYPGTPFTLELVTGVSAPETREIFLNRRVVIEAVVQPADAFETRVSWTSSDPSVVEVIDPDAGVIQGNAEGTAVLTVVTLDGSYSASCTVTVLPDPCIDGHNYTATVTEPTCTNWGYTTHTCTVCGDSYNDSYENALGHEWDDGAVTLQPTQTEKGEKTYTCKRCGETRKESIPELSHEHQYATTVTAPTCMDQGYTTHTCECGDSYMDAYVDALGHAWDDGVVTKEPTETENGTKTHNCIRCEAKLIEIIPALGHEHQYTATVTAPTCTDWGYTTYACTLCGDSYVDAYVSPLGHVWDNGVVTKEPTGTEQGEKTYTCTRCGETRTEIIPELEHVHQYAATVTAPTCTAQGYTTHTCACGDSYVYSYERPLGHAWDSGVVTKQPTETEQGEKTCTCTRCGATKTESIPATGGQADKPCDGGVDCPSGKFVDVSTKDWFHEAVDFAVEQGLFGGMGANTFEPNTPMTRAMLVTVLWRYEGKPEAPANTFSDVKAGTWYSDAVSWASANGVVNGVGSNKFDPEGNITREQMATILYRYSDGKGIDTNKQGSLSGFPDADKVSSYAQTAMQWTVAEGIIGGSDGKLLPQGNATRAQVATILMRFIQNIAEE